MSLNEHWRACTMFKQISTKYDVWNNCFFFCDSTTHSHWHAAFSLILIYVDKPLIKIPFKNYKKKNLNYIIIWKMLTIQIVTHSSVRHLSFEEQFVPFVCVQQQIQSKTTESNRDSCWIDVFMHSKLAKHNKKLYEN